MRIKSFEDLGKGNSGIYVSKFVIGNKTVYSTFYGNSNEVRFLRDRKFLTRHGVTFQEFGRFVKNLYPAPGFPRNIL